MDEQEKLPEHREEQSRERSGEYLWRVLKPAGCVIVLMILVLSLIFCFTYKSPPPEGASAPAAAVGSDS